MENSAATESIQREFGHCIVNWKIENYAFAAHGMEYEIKSELFSIAPHMTVWKMALKSELGLCDDREMMFSLQRMSDSGPETVWVNLDISLFDQDGKKWKAHRGQHRIERDDSKVLYLPNIYFGRVNVSLYNFNSITLLCQIIVHEGKTRCIYDEIAERGIVGLSLNMDQLCTLPDFTDVTLKLDEGSEEVAAHRAILSARSEIFEDVFSRDARPVFNCMFLHREETRQVLRYLYTGDVRPVLDNPSVSTADCITAFSVYELEDHYQADEQKLVSRIDVHQTGLKWEIEDFSKRDDEFILSDVVLGDMLEMAWQLRLYPRGIGGKDEYLTIIAENLEGKIDGHVWAKAEVFHDPSDRLWKAMQVVKEGELFELHNFESRDSVFEKLENDTLRICFKVCVSLGETHTSNVQKVNHIPTFPRDYYYKKLSKDIFSLRKDTRFTDIVVYADGKEFKAHKCILAVRSSKLRDLSDDLNEDKVVCIDNVRSDIVEIVLDYMYSGVLEKLDFDGLLEVYDAASKMGANYLTWECSHIFQNSVDENNVFKLLTAANAQQNELLKDICVRFLSANVNICDEILKKLESENLALSDELVGHLKKLKLNSF